MLTAQIRALKEGGLIRRGAFAEVPPRIECAATDRVMALSKEIDAVHGGWREVEVEG